MKKTTIGAIAAALAALVSCSSPLAVEAGDPAKTPSPAPSSSRAISLTSADPYENDDTQAAAKAIGTDGALQERNFYDDPTDWLSFTAIAGRKYVVETFVAGNTDTKVYVMDGTTQKGYNDDKTSSDYGSKVTFTAPSSKAYTVKVASYNNATGSGLGYTVSVTDLSGGTVTTYTVSYSANGATSGTAPTDSGAYASGATVTAAANSGNLAKTGYTFSGWNTSSAGTGTDRAAGSTFSMGSANVTLYAKWTVQQGGGNGTFTENFSLPQSVRDYYRSAYGLSGTALKAELQRIVTNTHTPKSYAALWTMYYTSDKAPNGKVWDMYSSTASDGSSASYWFTLGTDQAGTYSGEGDKYNREHTWPKSAFGGSETSTPGSDGHHVTPTDGYVNGKRSNWSYGEVGSATWTSMNGSKLGSPRSGLGSSGATVFEPVSIYKGDHARMHFYMALRYYNNSLFTTVDWANSGAKLKPWYDTMLDSWATADPVSAKERARNDAVQAHQGNRNPFIDYPELEDLIDFTN